MASVYRSDTKYGKDEGFIIALDIGTTNSAVSFCHLYRDEYPTVRSVTRWPGQESNQGDAKVPTMIAYQNGIAKHFGVEAAEHKDDEEYEIAHWFKLHLHPRTMKQPGHRTSFRAPDDFEVPPLPKGVNIRQAYIDFIGYLYNHTRSFFVQSTPNGQSIWERLQSRMTIIFTHPNGWDVSHQAFLADCTARAGIVPRTEAYNRIDFITEGEASVHYAVAHTASNVWLRQNQMFIVVDAGGSTVDSNLYQCTATNPLQLKEVCRSECIQAGGIYVDRAARKLLREKLASSKYGTDEFLDIMVNEFEKKTKRRFGGDLSSNVISFGRNSDNDREHGIFKGKITLTPEEIQSTFDDVVTKIVGSCLKLLRNYQIQPILLVGGFGESPLLQDRMRKVFKPRGIDVVSIDHHAKKSAVDGSVIWYLKQIVSGRAARFPIGIEYGIPYDPKLPEHRERSNLVTVWPDGSNRIDHFEQLIRRDAVLDQGWEYQKECYSYWDAFPGTIGEYVMNILLWEGEGEPKWTTDVRGVRLPGMRGLCTIKADLNRLAPIIKSKGGYKGRYWRLKWTLVIRLGETKIRAWIRWKDKGGIQQGLATVIPGTMY
ncbi:hypothetical protein CPB86DRAFT_767059 [Serendipita vermifera]|nr:hypothetical protein CPB86DRAFT_767059 [Serendipita vermifera]